MFVFILGFIYDKKHELVFGCAEINTASGNLTVEVKSVNSRTCNISVKLPESLSSLEISIINYIKGKINRGQVNVIISLNKNGIATNKKIVIDHELLKEYFKQIDTLKEYIDISGTLDLNTAINLPGIISIEEMKENVEEFLPNVQHVLDMAMAQFIETREKEGSAILNDILARLEIMSELISSIKSRAPQVIDEYRQRILKRLNDLMNGQALVDESRIAMEISIMAERCDISEEIVRLQSHIKQIKDSIINSKEPVGRHLDFILQEINREINTISSKANDYQISYECIRFKNEAEKIREQVQNIE